MTDWFPLGLGVGFYVVMAWQHLVGSISRIFFSSDTAVIGVMAALTDRYGVRYPMATGSPNNSFTTLLFDVATRGLPGRFEIWQAMPIVTTMLGVVVMLWVLRPHVSRFTLATTAALLLCPSYFVLTMTGAQAVHGLTMTAANLTVAAMTWIAASPRHRKTLVWVTLGLGALLGPTLASDPAAASWCIAPMLLVAGGRFLARGDREARHLLAVSVGATVLAGITGLATYITIRLMEISITNNAVASPLRHPRTFLLHASGNFVRAIPFAVAIYVLYRMWRRTARSLDRFDPLSVYGSFWIAMMISVLGSFVATGAASGGMGRYVGAPLLIAGCAVAPVAISAPNRLIRSLVSTAVGLAVAFAGFSLYTGTLAVNTTEVYRNVGAISQAIRAEGLRTGYSAYWSAAAITFRAEAKVEIFPLRTCNHRLCEFEVNTLRSWYTPRPNTRTFLMIDKYAPSPNLALGEDYALGAPTKTLWVGDVMIAVYDYDIASRLIRRDDPQWSSTG